MGDAAFGRLLVDTFEREGAILSLPTRDQIDALLSSA